MTLFEVWAQIRAEGGTTPQIVFHCGNGADRMVKHMEILWEEIYGPEKYRDLWFLWEGKPLLLGNSDSLGQEYRNFFTIRASWAFNDWTGDGIERWPWIAEYPQAPGRNAAGEIEQAAVAAGFHSNSSRGRSYVSGKQTLNGKKDFGFSLDTTDQGLAFSEQWEYAIELDPDVIMVTGWNEFTMGRWENEGIGQQMASTYEIVKDDPQFENNYVDCFNTAGTSNRSTASLETIIIIRWPIISACSKECGRSRRARAALPLIFPEIWENLKKSDLYFTIRSTISRIGITAPLAVYIPMSMKRAETISTARKYRKPTDIRIFMFNVQMISSWRTEKTG